MSLKLSSPWSTYYKQIRAMFGRDPEIKILYNEDDVSIKMYVDNPEKADAISQLLPKTKTFGNVTVKVEVIPSDREMIGVDGNLFDKAFHGNPVYCRSVHIEGIFVDQVLYVVFKKEVVQFFNDDMTDLHGLCSTLYENIAYDLFNIKGVFYCTDVDTDKSSPEDEWL